MFRDLLDQETKAFRTDVISLGLWPEQHDALFDNLPTLVEKHGKWRLPDRRVAATQSVVLT